MNLTKISLKRACNYAREINVETKEKRSGKEIPYGSLFDADIDTYIVFREQPLTDTAEVAQLFELRLFIDQGSSYQESIAPINIAKLPVIGVDFKPAGVACYPSLGRSTALPYSEMLMKQAIETFEHGISLTPVAHQHYCIHPSTDIFFPNAVREQSDAISIISDTYGTPDMRPLNYIRVEGCSTPEKIVYVDMMGFPGDQEQQFTLEEEKNHIYQQDVYIIAKTDGLLIRNQTEYPILIQHKREKDLDITKAISLYG